MKSIFLLNIAAIIGLVAIIVISVLAHIENEQVYLTDNMIIGKCIIRETTGIDCPSCGLTRSFVSISNGKLIEAFDYNYSGVLVYLLIICQIINSSIYLVKKKYNQLLSRFMIILSVVISVILITSWIYKIII